MNTNLNEAPKETDIILYRNLGRSPIIAGYFNGRWLTEDHEFEVELNTIMGWLHIPMA